MAHRNPGAFFSFLSHQARVHLPVPSESFAGQTVIITGSNTGLGLEAAIHIVRLGAEKVILAVRTASKGEDARKVIEEKTRRTDAVEVWELDMASYDSVKAFVKKAESLSRLDAVLENAGVLSPKFSMAGEDEYVLVFLFSRLTISRLVLAVNVISTFLLALLILPKLRESATAFGITPRITIVTSFLHNFAKLSAKSSPRILDYLNDESKANMDDRFVPPFPQLRTYSIGSRYGETKMLQIFYIRQLAPAMTNSGKAPVTLNCVCPGWAHSGILRERNGLGERLSAKAVARSTEEGSRQLVQGVIEGHNETHGKYITFGEIAA